MQTYWELRAQANENYAAKIATQMTRRVRELNRKMRDDLLAHLDAIMKEVEEGKILTRTDLYNSKRYIALLNAIQDDKSAYRDGQVRYTSEALDRIFESVIGRTSKDFKKQGISFTQLSDFQKEQLIKTQWLGSNYSQRIWKNTDALATKLSEALPDMILTGKDARKALREAFNVDYHVASRLVRTESAHIYTEASKAQYRAANIEQVKYIAELDCCEICEQYRGNTYPLNEAPMIPQHCNCRCCLAPVVNLK